MDNNELIKLIKKTIVFIQNNSEAKKMFLLAGGRENFTVWSFIQAAGNHLFDDYPEIFNLTETQGHSIRRYFQTTKPEAISTDFKDFMNPGLSSLD